MEVSGGPVLPVAEGTDPHWGLEETLVFTEGGSIYQVSPFGGSQISSLRKQGITLGRSFSRMARQSSSSPRQDSPRKGH